MVRVSPEMDHVIFRPQEPEAVAAAEAWLVTVHTHSSTIRNAPKYLSVRFIRSPLKLMGIYCDFIIGKKMLKFNSWAGLCIIFVNE